MTDKAASAGTITLREHFDNEFATIRRDLDLLNKTIKETADAHGMAHDRDHRQTELATNKAEIALKTQLDQIKAEFSRADEERKRQIEEMKEDLSDYKSLWSGSQGQSKGSAAVWAIVIALSGFGITILIAIVFVVSNVLTSR